MQIQTIRMSAPASIASQTAIPTWNTISSSRTASLPQTTEAAFAEQLPDHPRKVRIVQHFDGVGYP
jgi:hypothetical protein